LFICLVLFLSFKAFTQEEEERDAKMSNFLDALESAPETDELLVAPDREVTVLRKVNAAQENINRLTVNYNNIVGKLSDIDKENLDLKAKLQAADERVQAVNLAIEPLRQDNQRLKKDNQQLTKAIALAEQEKDSYIIKIKELEKKISELREKLDYIGNQIKDM